MGVTEPYSSRRVMTGVNDMIDAFGNIAQPWALLTDQRTESLLSVLRVHPCQCGISHAR